MRDHVSKRLRERDRVKFQEVEKGTWKERREGRGEDKEHW